MREFLNSDLKSVNEWLGKRGVKEITEDDLPRMGFIEPGIAAGFLCVAEGKTCFLEAYVSNPSAAKETRNKVIDSITKELIKTAKNKGFKRILALTKSASLRAHAFKNGLSMRNAVTFFSMEL